MKLIQFGVRNDYGQEYYAAFLVSRRYSLLQIAFDIGEYCKLLEWPYLSISMGYGRLFSFTVSIGRLGFSFDIFGRNWRDDFLALNTTYEENDIDLG
jgi:hypothetical protein